MFTPYSGLPCQPIAFQSEMRLNNLQHNAVSPPEFAQLIPYRGKYVGNGTLISLARRRFDNLFLVYFFLVHLRLRPAIFPGINHPPLWVDRTITTK